MPWYFVTCRIAFDDEDSGYPVQADSPEDAAEKARQQLVEDAGLDEDDDPTVYILYVVECGEREPVIRRVP